MANNKKTLVVYFSQYGTTKRVAEQIAETIGAGLLEIHRTKKYPKLYLALVAVAKRELNALFVHKYRKQLLILLIMNES